MAIDTKYQYDVHVNYQLDSNSSVSGKANLSLTSGGDIGLVSGKDKLIAQVIRYIVNKDTDIPFNIPSGKRHLKTLFVALLTQFIELQISSVSENSAGFLGYYIYKQVRPDGFYRNTENKFIRITDDPVTHTYTDADVVNGTNYSYGLARVFSGGIELPIHEKFLATPSTFTHNHTVVFGSSGVLVQQDASLKFYLSSNRVFKQSELLRALEAVDVSVSATEPRRYNVELRLRSLFDELITLAQTKQIAY